MVEGHTSSSRSYRGQRHHHSNQDRRLDQSEQAIRNDIQRTSSSHKHRSRKPYEDRSVRKDSRGFNSYDDNQSNHLNSQERRGDRGGRAHSDRKNSSFHKNRHKSNGRFSKFDRRGGRGRNHDDTARTERQRIAGPELPDWADAGSLAGDVRRELHMLSKENAEQVARHMVAAYGFIDDDPARALAHAHAARDHAGRIAVVRENAGVVAYLTGNWKEALSELRAARRIGGGPGLLPMMADCQRALDRPEKAIEMLRSEPISELERNDFIEFIIVVAGAYSDLQDFANAKKLLEQGDLRLHQSGSGVARLFYAYADILLRMGDDASATIWFERAADADIDDDTDAIERVAELKNLVAGDK